MTYQDVFAGYDAKRDQMRAFLRRHYVAAFDLVPGTLLDAGCGNGFWAGLFADAGFTVRGFDTRPDLIAEARARHPDLRFLVADAEEPLRFIGKHDTVFARTLPQFYARTFTGAEKVIANLLRHVAPEGLLLLSIYSDGSGRDRPLVVGGTAHHYRDSELIGLVERVAGSEPIHRRIGNYLQIGVQA